MFTFELLWNHMIQLICYLLISTCPNVCLSKWTFNKAVDPVDICPPMCDCSHSESSRFLPSASLTTHPNDLINKFQESSESILARCWIASDLVHLQCTPKWTILHLQILNGIIDHKRSLTSASKIDYIHSSSNDFNHVPNDNVETHLTIQPSNSLFTYCNTLTRLAIWEKSQFNTISRHLFQPLSNLIRLIIQAPKLQNLPNHFLIFLPKLNFLMISKCTQLKQFSPNVFEPCPKDLRTLWLNNNALNGRLHSGLFRQCNLNTLWLNDNQLELIDSGSLIGLENLIDLRLDHNLLRNSLEYALGITINSNLSALIETPNLKIIDLSYNQLESINDYHWSGLCIYHDTIHMGLCKLEQLKLSFNQLKFISPKAFIGLPKLQKLDLEGNLQLYNTESIVSLTVALHALNFVNIYLKRLILSLPFKSNTSNQLQTIDICNSNSNSFDSYSIDLALKQILIQLNQTKCHRLKNHTQPYLTSETLSHVVNQTKSCPYQHTNDILIDETLQSRPKLDQDSIITYIRRADRLMLSLICIGILFTGGILTTCLFALIHCLIRTNYFKSICHSPNSRQLSMMGDQIEPLITTPSSMTSPNHTGHLPTLTGLANENYLNSSFLNYSLKKLHPRPNIDLPPTPTSTSSTHISTQNLPHPREDYSSSRYCIPVLLGPYGSGLEISNRTNGHVNRIQTTIMGITTRPSTVTTATTTTTAPTSPIAQQTKTMTRRNNSTSNMYARPQTILGLSGLNRHVKHQYSNKQFHTDPIGEINTTSTSRIRTGTVTTSTTTTTTTNASSYSLTTNQSIQPNHTNLNREPHLPNGKFKQIRE